MASQQESRVSEATKPRNPDEAEATKRPEQAHAQHSAAGMDGVAQVEAVTSTRSTSPIRNTRKLFQDKVHEAVQRARYGQWDFDFSRSPGAADTAGDDVTPPPLTVPPWGPVSAKEIFAGTLRPNYDDPNWKYTRQTSGNNRSPQSPGSTHALAE